MTHVTAYCGLVEIAYYPMRGKSQFYVEVKEIVMDLMGLLLMSYSLVRWVIVIVTVVALVWFALVLFANQSEQRYDKILLVGIFRSGGFASTAWFDLPDLVRY